jgi:SNF2 family DNA or RNA helicase
LNGIPSRIEFRSGEDEATLRFWQIEDVSTLARRAATRPSDQEAVAQAAQWLLDLDFRASQRFVSGSTVSRSIRREEARPLPSPESNWSLEELRRQRQPAADLIQPRLKCLGEREELFPYQREGVVWLKNHTNGILADDMGLGKTPQAIIAMRDLIASGQIRWALVACPRSLLANWEAELVRWAPELSRFRLVPLGTLREHAWATMVGRVHVVVTNFEQLRHPPEALRGKALPLLIADEAHRIRNAGSQVTAGIRELKAERFWALTGTPVERDALDLATLLSLVDKQRFAVSDAELPVSVLRARARPLVLRRQKSEVLRDLPKVVEHVEILELEPGQRLRYKSALARLDHHSAGFDDTLRLLNELRQICDYDKVTGDSCKLTRILELVGEISDADEKVVIFSTLVEPLRMLQGRLSDDGIIGNLLTGEVRLAERERIVNRFRKQTEEVALLATTWVAGEGLTLTEANHVIFINEWWNPSTNTQARDRVVRIGQNRGVQVYRFYCRGTVEQALTKVLSRKSELYDDLVEQLSETGKPTSALIKDVMDELRRDRRLGSS